MVKIQILQPCVPYLKRRYNKMYQSSYEKLILVLSNLFVRFVITSYMGKGGVSLFFISYLFV